MQKLLLLSLVLVLTVSASSAQSISITGTVKTQDGDALQLAFIQDKIHKAGVYSDSTGYFTLSVYPDSKLRVKCFGFRDTTFSINNQTTFNIVLRANVNIRASRGIEPSNADPISLATFRDMIVGELATQNIETSRENYTSPGKDYAKPDMAQGAIFPVFQHKEATQGSRYLFDTWVHGYITNSKDSIIQNAGLFYNYDKIAGNLLITRDRHAAIELYKTSVPSFTVFDISNQPLTFTLVPQIDKDHYVEVISSGAIYSIFKQITTKFVAANYSTDGVASTGNDFDSYQNQETYYILNAKTGQLQKLSLKKKALKEAFADQAQKLNKFMSENSGDIDDNYLNNLCQYMNR